jgi:hypothetical protein
MSDGGFKAWAGAAFALTGLCIVALVVNAATASRFSDFLVPVAFVALIAGGIILFRVRWLWFRGRNRSRHDR